MGRGGTLEDFIAQQGGPLPSRTAIELTLQVAGALDAAHRSGVIHRDIKPQNILLTESGEAKVTDFGIARATAASTKLTRTGAMLGTLHYLAPEQAHGEPASAQSDLYALGVVLYQMLTEELPFDAQTPAAIMIKHITEPLRPPKEVNSNIPERLNAVVVRLLAKEPEECYPDTDALIEDLDGVLRSLAEGDGAAAAQSPVSERSLEDKETVIEDDQGTVTDRPVSSSERTLEEEDFAEAPIVDETVASPPYSRTVQVPDPAGQNVSRAGSILADVGLTLGDQEEAPSEMVSEDEIVGQTPRRGRRWNLTAW